MPPTYSPKHLDQMAAAVGMSSAKVAALSEDLETAALWYRLRTRMPKRRTPSQLRDDLKSIRGHAEKLLKKMGYPDPTDVIDGPDDRSVFELLSSSDGASENAILAAAERIKLLNDIVKAAQAASDIYSQSDATLAKAIPVRKSMTPEGHAGDIAVNDWIAALMEIYEDLTGNKARTSVGGRNRPDEGEAGGPLIRFLMAAQKPIGLDFASDALRSRVRTLLDHARA